jgi:hypothetical protein
MKSLAEYLIESKKTYSFKIGVAGELPEGFEDKLESMLQKYSVQNMSTGKKTPIQERPLDFPQLQNMEVTYYTVELLYPTTSSILEEYVSTCSGVHRSYIRVVNPHAQEIADGNVKNKDTETYDTLLTSDYKDPITTKEAQSHVGDSRVMDLLKELEKARKERATSEEN